MNNNYSRKMSYEKSRFKSNLIEGLLAGSSITVVIGTMTTGIYGVIFFLEKVYNSDMSKSYRDNLNIQNELHRRNRKKDVFFQDKDGIWCARKE